MTDPSLLGPWVRRFLLEYLISVRNLALNTQRSYRDTLSLLIRAVAGQTHKTADQLGVTDLSASCVIQFLQDLEHSRHCGVGTRNQRLAGIRALAHFIALHSPEHLEWCGQIFSIPFKKTTNSPPVYLEESEMEALLAAPDRSTWIGRRDRTLFLNALATRPRVSELTVLTCAAVQLGGGTHARCGKERKERTIPSGETPERSFELGSTSAAGPSATRCPRA